MKKGITVNRLNSSWEPLTISSYAFEYDKKKETPKKKEQRIRCLVRQLKSPRFFSPFFSLTDRKKGVQVCFDEKKKGKKDEAERFILRKDSRRNTVLD